MRRIPQKDLTHRLGSFDLRDGSGVRLNTTSRRAWACSVVRGLRMGKRMGRFGVRRGRLGCVKTVK